MRDTFTFRKRTLVTGVEATAHGIIETERGPMEYSAGDWLLTTIEGPEQTWPVSREYLEANYELVDDD